MPTISGWLKKQYCTDQYETCARYILRQHEGASAVPVDMYPEEQQRAKDIIAKRNPSRKA